MLNVMPYFLCYSMPLAYLWGLHVGGLAILAPLFIGFVIVPLADLVFGRDHKNLSTGEEKLFKNLPIFRAVTLLWVPVQCFIVFYSLWYLSSSSENILFLISAALACGVVTGGIGITVAHELCHRQTKIENFASQVILLMTNYMHFHVEHNVGHHQRVSTPEDPASARFNQSLYAFLPQTLIGSLKSLAAFERKRVRVKKLSWFQNRLYLYGLMQVALSILVILAFGFYGLFFHLAQSFFAILFLELVNYIEHYGLERRKLSNGRYEKVQPIHSWNANHKVSNYLLLKLQRHSDHHANPLRRYQTLRDMPEAPQLPMGYPGMIILALCPPLWRKVMNPRVESFRRGKAALA